MSIVIPIIAPDNKPHQPEDFHPKVGVAHNLKLGRHGIEAGFKNTKEVSTI